MKKVFITLLILVFVLNFSLEAKKIKWSKIRDKAIDAFLNSDDDATDATTTDATDNTTDVEDLNSSNDKSDYVCAYIENLESENWKKFKNNKTDIFITQIKENWNNSKIEFYTDGLSRTNPMGIIYNFKDESNFDYIKFYAGNKENFIVGSIKDGVDRIKETSDLLLESSRENQTFVVFFNCPNFSLYLNGKKIIDINISNFKLNNNFGLAGKLYTKIKLYLPKKSLSNILEIDDLKSDFSDNLKLTFKENFKNNNWESVQLHNLNIKLFKINEDYNNCKIEFNVGDSSYRKKYVGVVYNYSDMLNFNYMILGKGTKDNLLIYKIIDGEKKLLYLADINNELKDYSSYIFIFNDNTIRIFNTGKKIFHQTFKNFNLGNNFGIIWNGDIRDSKIYLPEKLEIGK